MGNIKWQTRREDAVWKTISRWGHRMHQLGSNWVHLGCFGDPGDLDHIGLLPQQFGRCCFVGSIVFCELQRIYSKCAHPENVFVSVFGSRIVFGMWKLLHTVNFNFSVTFIGVFLFLKYLNSFRFYKCQLARIWFYSHLLLQNIKLLMLPWLFMNALGLNPLIPLLISILGFTGLIAPFSECLQNILTRIFNKSELLTKISFQISKTAEWTT